MKYAYSGAVIPQERRKEINDKILYLIDSGKTADYILSAEDIFHAYTGNGGLHGLKRCDYDNYAAYSDAKKDMEQGQFFTPSCLCELVVSCLKLSETDLIADLTCGMGNFFNFMPTESNVYGCELDIKAYKVAQFLYPQANLHWGDIRSYEPEVRFDYVVGNPPFHLEWWVDGIGAVASQLYYCKKAAQVLKPLGIMALIVPCSFLADSFTDGGQIKTMEKSFGFLGQVRLPENLFASLGIHQFPVKLQFWQKKSQSEGWTAQPYDPEIKDTLRNGFSVSEEAERIYGKYLQFAKANLEKNSLRVLLELSKTQSQSADFSYRVQKLLYHIKIHPGLRSGYAKCCEYLHRFYTQTQPQDMSYETWCKTKITETKVLAYLQRVLKKQNPPPEREHIALVKQNYQFVYKGYSAKSRKILTDFMRHPTPVYQAVLENQPASFPGYEKFLRRKRTEYENQLQPFAEMDENPQIADWLMRFSLWDSEKEECIRLNPMQRHDINLILQKHYGFLQWEQGSGKTLAGIAVGQYRMQKQNAHSTWVISSAISIRNNWDIVLKNYRLSYVFVERLSDLERIRRGDFVLLTLNNVSKYQKQLAKWVKQHGQKIQLVLDESDEISNSAGVRCQSVLAVFRRCRFKLLATGTSTRNNISEFAPQLELLYNNSIHMISWNPTIYSHDKDNGSTAEATDSPNPFYGKPIPAYKKGYALFAASHLPERITVFGMEKRTQDIYNADVLSTLLGKTVITRTFEEVANKKIKRLHQLPVRFSPEEQAVYQRIIDEFFQLRDHYFTSTENTRKDSMMKLMQQIVLLLRVSAAPDTMAEYEGDTPVKIMTAVELIAQWPEEIVAVGVRHKNVLEAYEKAFQEYLPERPLFIVTGSTVSFAKRRELRQTLQESRNGILLCTQQSLPSSVNFEYVNKVIIPELHYNHSGMSQFYFRFIRYTSTDYKDIYFLTYAGSIESNLMQMILAKEKINLFMKGDVADLNAIYERFDVDYDLLSLLMYREKDENGKLHIRWGQQRIA